LASANIGKVLSSSVPTKSSNAVTLSLTSAFGSLYTFLAEEAICPALSYLVSYVSKVSAYSN